MSQRKASRNEEYQTSLFCQEDSRVNPIALPESEKAKRTNGTCGRKCLGLLEKLGQLGCLEKMSPDCLPQIMECEYWKSRKIWKRKTTKQGLSYLQQVTMVQLLRGNGYSSLPRPRVADTEGAPVKNSENLNGSWSRKNRKGVRYGVKLKDVLFKLYGIKKPCPEIYEAIMGFPIGWTDLSA